MLKSFANIFRIPDLKKKVIFTLSLLMVERVGCYVPSPFIDPVAVKKFFSTQMAGLLSFIDLFSGGAFSNMTIMALGIMPYITTSIIMQLLVVVIPFLERLSKEGEAGRKAINKYTRWGTVFVCMFQSLGIAVWMLKEGLTANVSRSGFLFITMISMTAGTIFLMWLGEKITEHGIGNGISLIIMAGIVARFPNAIILIVQQLNPFWMILLAAIIVGITAFIVVLQLAQRRIPIQHAKRVVGRKMMTGQSSFLPLRINTAGVIPIIFAASILTFPATIMQFLGGKEGFLGGIASVFSSYSPYNLYNFLQAVFGMETGGFFYILKIVNFYTFIYLLMIIFFCYFYTAITFNPIEIADNLKKYGAFIPGRRPGKYTSDYIYFILNRITLVGAVCLAVIAIIPQVLTVSYNIPYTIAQFTGGTGMIIVVGVALETVRQIESHLIMRNYSGFMKRSSGSKGYY